MNYNSRQLAERECIKILTNMEKAADDQLEVMQEAEKQLQLVKPFDQNKDNSLNLKNSLGSCRESC